MKRAHLSIIKNVYIAIAVCIIVSTTILFWYYYPDNWYLWNLPFSLIGLGIMIYVCGRSSLNVTLSARKFHTLLFVIPIIVFFVQILIAFYYPFRYDSDLLVVKETAMYISEHHTLGKHYDYFQSFPNNLNITLTCSILYHFFRSWEVVTLFGALLVNISSVLTCLIVRHYSKSNTTAFISLIVSEFILSFTFIAYPPYTHNFGIIFPILQVYIYTLPLEHRLKAVLLFASVAIGALMKVTTLVPFIGIAVIEIFKITNMHRFRRALGYAFFFMAIYGCAHLFQNIVWKEVGYVENTAKKNNISYFFLLGQSTDSGGRCDGKYAALASTLNVEKEQKDSIFVTLAKENIRERGFLGNVKFYIGKLCMCWGDSSFSSYKISCKNPQMQKYLRVYTVPRQILWYFILIMLFLTPLKHKGKNLALLYLCIIGVTFYLLLFEAESRYIFMFAPLVLSLSIIGAHETLAQYKKSFLEKHHSMETKTPIT